MARTWTPQRNEQLMLSLIGKITVTPAMRQEVAAEWKANYPDDNFQPTAKAITEQIAALKRRVGTGGSTANGNTPKTTTKINGAARHTPSGVKRSAPKTPTSSAKRPRKNKMSDEDEIETDDDDEVDLSKIIKRETPSRHAATNMKKSYLEESDEEDYLGDSVDEAITSASKPSSISGANDSVVDSPTTTLAQHGGRSSKARSKLDPPSFDAAAAAAEDSDKDLL